MENDRDRLKIVPVAADGQCLFNSISYLLHIHEQRTITKASISKYASKLRKIICDLMKDDVDKEVKLPFADRHLIHQLSMELETINNEGSGNDVRSPDQGEKAATKKAYKYVRLMGKSKTWGGLIELKYIFRLLTKGKSFGYKGIRVYRLEKTPRKKTDTVTGLTMVGKLIKIKGGMDTLINNGQKKPVLEIMLHNFEQGGAHYDPLVPVRRKDDK